jgi:hypothetical protein
MFYVTPDPARLPDPPAWRSLGDKSMPVGPTGLTRIRSRSVWRHGRLPALRWPRLTGVTRRRGGACVDHPASPAVTLTTSCRGIAAIASVLSQSTPKRRVFLDERQNGMNRIPLVAACAPSSVRLPPRSPRRDSGLRGAHRAGYRDRSDAPRAPWRRAPRFHSRRSGAGYAAGHAGRPGSAPPAEGGRWPAWVAGIFTINLTIYVK